jgi:predicted nucleic acid-binding protein
MPRILPDTNVLFPFSLMDLFLALAEDFVIDLVLSDRLLDEWERVIVRGQRRAPESAKKIADIIRVEFAASIVPAGSYQRLLDQLTGPDPDDLHHIAAAVQGRADTIVTSNIRDFPAVTLAPHGIVASRPDPYLCDLLDRHPDQILRTVTRMASGKKKPPMTVLELAARFDRAGVPDFASRLRQLVLHDMSLRMPQEW